VLDSFAEAAGKILPKLAGIRLAESTVERTTEAAGGRLGRLLAQGRTFAAAADWAWHRDAEGRPCAYVSVDATGVGQQGRRGAAAEGRMAYVGMIYNPVPDGHDGPRPPTRARYLAGLYDLDDLGAQLRLQAAQVGMERAERWLALTDGGNGLEEFVRVHFPRAEPILDFWHAAGHLAELAKALHPTDEEAAGALAQQWCHVMKHDGGGAILGRLEALDVGRRSEAVRETHRRVVGYVRNNEHRMDYPRYRSRGWQIGSGPVEAACKTVVGQRLKGGGMRWGEDGADAVCHLRALWRSESGQWDAFWGLGLN
jgi:hypothetical protein